MNHPIIFDGHTHREMTETEYADYVALVAELQSFIETQQATQAAQETAKASARSKLKALGLTDDEIAALVG